MFVHCITGALLTLDLFIAETLHERKVDLSNLDTEKISHEIGKFKFTILNFCLS